MKFEQLLARNVRGFWATSYSFGLKLFDQYLLRKLSQNTLNAVVLADHDKLADVWEHLAANERYLARRAGSRYLLRGIRPAEGGAFHAKPTCSSAPTTQRSSSAPATSRATGSTA